MAPLGDVGVALEALLLLGTAPGLTEAGALAEGGLLFLSSFTHITHITHHISHITLMYVHTHHHTVVTRLGLCYSMVVNFRLLYNQNVSLQLP